MNPPVLHLFGTHHQHKTHQRIVASAESPRKPSFSDIGTTFNTSQTTSSKKQHNHTQPRESFIALG